MSLAVLRYLCFLLFSPVPLIAVFRVKSSSVRGLCIDDRRWCDPIDTRAALLKVLFKVAAASRHRQCPERPAPRLRRARATSPKSPHPAKPPGGINPSPSLPPAPAAVLPGPNPLESNPTQFSNVMHTKNANQTNGERFGRSEGGFPARQP